MIERASEKEIKQEQNNHKDEEAEIDLMDILRKVIATRKIIYKAAGVGLIIGIIIAISIPKQYTVSVTLSPEMGNSKGGNGLAGLAASFLGNGAAMGDGSDALNASLSAEIVSSTPFLLELCEMKVPVSKEKEEPLSLYLESQSSPWWNYVIGLPGIVIGGVRSLFEDKEKVMIGDSKSSIIALSKEELKKVEYLKKNVTATISKKTAITNITVTLQNPKVAAILADSVVRKLQKNIINYRTFKSKEDCLYLEKLFKERQQEYYIAQQRYANYVDSHDNLILQSVRVEQERLQNDMSLAYQVYSQVANQLQVARAKVQEESPVFAIVEPAVVPLQASSVGLKAYAFVFMILCSAIAVSWKLKGQEIWKTLRDNKIN